MATVANSLVDRDANVIKEFIGEVAIELMQVSEPMFANTFIDEVASDSAPGQLGRDLRIKSRYYGSLAGVMRGGNVKNYFSLYGDQTADMGPNLFTNSIGGTFPNPMHGANPRSFGLTAKLYSMETNLALSQTMLDMEVLPANIKEHVMPVLRGFAKLLNLTFCNAIHLNPTNQYRLGSLGTAGATGYSIDTTNKTIKFYPTEKCTHRFATGQPVDIFVSSTVQANKSDTTASRVRCFVGNVDDAEGWVLIQADPAGTAEDGTTATFGNGTTTGWAGTTNLSTTSFVVNANTYNAGFAGMYALRDWFKWGGSTNGAKRILGDSAVTDSTDDYIDTTDHAAFKSVHFGAVGSLNERKLCAQMAAVIRAFIRHGHSIDKLVASEGVWLNIFDQLLAREMIIRGGAGGTLGGMGFNSDGTFTYEGMTVSRHTSRFIESGVIYGCKQQGNWRFVTPPSGGGLGKGSLPDKKPGIPLEFVGKALGHASDRIPLQVVEGGIVQTTEWSHMPGRIRIQFMPKQNGQIPGCVWEGVKETRIYSDTV